jgi:hypothetical protein
MSVKQVAPIKAISILATAFLASLSASSFFFIQPGSGANADSVSCSTQGVVSDVNDTTIKLRVNLSDGCPLSNGILYGVDGNGIAYKLAEVVQSDSTTEVNGKETVVEITLTDDYSYYTFEIEKAFSAKIESK